MRKYWEIATMATFKQCVSQTHKIVDLIDTIEIRTYDDELLVDSWYEELTAIACLLMGGGMTITESHEKLKDLYHSIRYNTAVVDHNGEEVVEPSIEIELETPVKDSWKPFLDEDK